MPLSETWEAACAVSADVNYQKGRYPVLSKNPKDITLVQYRVDVYKRQSLDNEGGLE